MSEIKKALEKALKQQTVVETNIIDPLLKSVSVSLNVPAVKYTITQVGQDKTLEYLLSTVLEEARENLRRSVEQAMQQMLHTLPTKPYAATHQYQVPMQRK